MPLDGLLGALDAPRHHARLDRHAVRHPEPPHQLLDAVAGEDAHEIVFEREVEPRAARIALAPRAAPQLVVDAPRLVALRADDMQPASRHDLFVLGGDDSLGLLDLLLPERVVLAD